MPRKKQDEGTHNSEDAPADVATASDLEAAEGGAAEPGEPGEPEDLVTFTGTTSGGVNMSLDLTREEAEDVEAGGGIDWDATFNARIGLPITKIEATAAELAALEAEAVPRVPAAVDYNRAPTRDHAPPSGEIEKGSPVRRVRVVGAEREAEEATP